MVSLNKSFAFPSAIFLRDNNDCLQRKRKATAKKIANCSSEKRKMETGGVCLTFFGNLGGNGGFVLLSR